MSNESPKITLSPLELQIQKLQFQKSKIDYYKNIKKKLNDESEKSSFITEVQNELNSFIDSKIQEIETGKESIKKVEVETFTAQEISILKSMTNRLLDKKPLVDQKTPEKVENKKVDVQEQMYQINFVKENKHLLEKRVGVKVPNGIIYGNVISFEVPNFVVRTFENDILKVSKENVIL